MNPLVRYRNHLWTHRDHGAILLSRPGAMAWITRAELVKLEDGRDMDALVDQLKGAVDAPVIEAVVA